jgi:L-alanine-DL-glutamate epimerase-like enolase superfamily enzyme
VNIVDWQQHPVDVQVPVHGAAIRLGGMRRIWIVQMRTSDGIIGWGECTQALDLAAMKATLPWHMQSVSDAFQYACAVSAHASGRFAVESALLDAWATKQGVPLMKCVAVRQGAGMSNAVVVNDATQAKQFMGSFDCFKVKLTADAQQDLDRCTSIRQAVGNTVVLRGDANQTWSLEQTPARLRQLAHLDFQFIEEPCPDAHRLTVLQLPIPIALDESIATIASSSWPTLLTHPGLWGLVLKPAWLGGISPCIAMATMAAQAHKQAVVTHALDGPIGMAGGFHTAVAVHGMMQIVDDGGDPTTRGRRNSIGFGNNPTLTPSNGRWMQSVPGLDGPGIGFTNPPEIDKWFQPNGDATT